MFVATIAWKHSHYVIMRVINVGHTISLDCLIGKQKLFYQLEAATRSDIRKQWQFTNYVESLICICQWSG